MIGIAAQVSLYPLRQASLAPAIDEALRVFREHGLEVAPGTMSTLIKGDDAALFAALREAFHRTAEQGHVVMVVTVSNACPVPAEHEDAISYQATEYVESEFDAPAAPAQRRAT